MFEPLNIPDLAQDILNTSIKGIEQLVEKLSTITANPVFITDPHYQTLSSASPLKENKIDKILAIQQLEQFENSQAFSCNIMTMESDYYGIGAPIHYENKTLGYLFFIDNEQSTAPMDLGTLLVFAASLAAIQLYRNLEIRKEKMKFKETFLFNLLFGNIKQKDEIEEYGAIWGWNFENPQTVVVFSLTDFNHVTTDKQLVQSLLYLVERTLLDKNMKPITMKRQNQVIAILSMEEKNPKTLRTTLEAITSAITTQMSTLHSSRKFACGIGKTYQNPVDLFRSYQEAKVALEVGVLLKVPIPYFSELGLERILYKHDLQGLREYYHSVLGELLHYDQMNNAQLMETLEALAENQFDMTAASKALFLHRNTLRYRLKRIEEILDLELDDLNNKLNITAAFKIKQLRKI